jgi:hypothetical protein
MLLVMLTRALETCKERICHGVHDMKYVRLFYEFSIPTLIVGMVLFVASDARKRLVDRKNKERRYD